MKNYYLYIPVSILFFLCVLNTNEVKQEQLVQPHASPQIDDYVVNIFEDSKGNLWFGTMAAGVAKFDGKTLSYLTTKDGLCENTVAGIIEDDNGNIWFGTHNGASRYDGKNIINYKEKEGLHGAGCKFLVDKKGILWAGTNDGAFKFNGSSFVEFKIPVPNIKDLSCKWVAGKVWDMMEDKNGNIWFGRDGYGACKYDGTHFVHYTKKDGLPGNNVSRVVEDKNGNIWFACLNSDNPMAVKEGGICYYNGETFTKFNENGLYENDIYTIYADKAGNMWVGATRCGVYRYNNGKFTLFTETDRNDLTKNFGVQSILEDSRGTLWFGFSGGLFKFNGNGLINITRDGPWE